MNDAPEAIWAVPLEMHGSILVGGWADTIRQCPNGTQYIRTDIADAAKDAAHRAGYELAQHKAAELGAHTVRYDVAMKGVK